MPNLNICLMMTAGIPAYQGVSTDAIDFQPQSVVDIAISTRVINCMSTFVNTYRDTHVSIYISVHISLCIAT